MESYELRKLLHDTFTDPEKLRKATVDLLNTLNDVALVEGKTNNERLARAINRTAKELDKFFPHNAPNFFQED